LNNYITDQFFGEKGVRSYKAPTGYMYQIIGINVSNFDTDSNQFVVSDFQSEDRDTLSIEQGFFVMDLAVDGTSHYVYFGDHGITCKFLSVGPSSDIAIQVVFTIYYKLVKASTPELIKEFVARGKNP
jgi:hypothetical protein